MHISTAPVFQLERGGSPGETAARKPRNCPVPWIARIPSMIVMSVVTALVVLALVKQAGVLAVQRAFPPQGRMIEVDGAALHLVDIGPRDQGRPILMLHGASSNLEAMRRPLGDLLARNPSRHPDRPSRPWLEHAGAAAGFD